MRNVFFIMNFDRSIDLYLKDNIYSLDTSDRYYPKLIECIKKSNFKEIAELLQKI